MGLAEIETDPRGDPDVKAPLKKTAPSSNKEHTQKEPVVKSEMAGVVVGGGKKLSKYRELVKEIMVKQNMRLPDAAKYIKENNLYKKYA